MALLEAVLALFTLKNFLTGILLFVLVKTISLVFQWQREETTFHSIRKVPATVPMLGHLYSILTSGAVWDLFADWILQYGNTLRFPMWNETVILTADVGFVKHMMIHDFNKYHKHLPTFEPFLTILGKGLVTSHGELWKNQRRIIGVGFVGDMLDIAMYRGFEAVERLSKRMDDFRIQKKPLELDEEFRRMAIGVIGQAVLSMEPAECDRIFPDLYLPIVEEANRQTWWFFRKYLPLPGVMKANSSLKKLNKYVCDIIRNRANDRAAIGHKATKGDVLDRVLDGCELSDASPLSDAQMWQLCDEVKTFLLAGHETTASTLIWSVYELLRHPEAMARVREEAEALYPPNSEGIDKGRFTAGLSFTEAVIRETLRLYSVVPMLVRTPIEDDEFEGMNIPKGTWVAIMVRAIHLRPDLWENPTEWLPERFLDHKTDVSKNFFAFTQGPRRCMGQFFSITESKVVLSRLVQQFNFHPVQSLEDVRRHPYVVPVCPHVPFLVHTERRK